MKQTIEIDVPDGYKAVYNKDTQKVEMVEIELPKTWEEFCDMFPKKIGEYYISSNSDIVDTIIEGKRLNKNLLPNKAITEAFLALMQLIQLRDCYRQGWKPDWGDGSKKHCIVVYDIYIHKESCVKLNTTLSFQVEEIRDEFLENFRDLIEKAKELI